MIYIRLLQYSGSGNKMYNNVPSMKLTTTMMAVAAICAMASGCVSTQTAADRANTVRLKLDAAQDEAYLNP